MRLFFRFLLVFQIGCPLLLSAQGIEFFHGSWDSVKLEARRQNKPVFVDCFTTWCGPCKRMAADIFTREDVGDFYNKNFIAYKMDMEKGKGPEVGKTYKIGFYPTYLFFSPQGELIHKAMGMKDAPNFINDGKNALDTTLSVFGKIRRFKRGERDTSFLWDLIVATQDLEPEIQMQAVAIYWNNIPKERLAEEKQWRIFAAYENDIHSSKFRYVMDNLKAFEEKLGKDEVENTVFNKVAGQMQASAEKNDEKGFEEAASIMANADNPQAKRFAAYAEVDFYKSQKKWDVFLKKADYYAANFAKGRAHDLAQLALEATASDNKKVLKHAEGWAKEAMEVMPDDYRNTTAYAQVLLSEGKFKEAEAAATKAEEQAKKAGADYKDIENLLLKARAAKEKEKR